MSSICCAVLCNDSALSTTAQAAFRSALVIPEDRSGPCGLAHYQAGQPLLTKQPRSDGSFNLVDRMEPMRSSLVVAHVSSTDARRTNEDTQPFRFGHWTWAHSGLLPHSDQVKQELLAAIPSFMRRNIRGQTSAEVIFHLFLAFLNDAGKLQDHHVTREVAGKALNAALAYVDRLLDERKLARPNYCTIASNGRLLVATHRGGPLLITRNAAYTNVGTGPDDKPLSYPHLKAVVLVGGITPTSPGWESIQEGVVASVDEGLNINYANLSESAEADPQ